MRLPDGSGLDVLRWLEESGRREKAIVITAYGSAENAVEALKAGAYDYLTKPVDLKQFRGVVASALGRGGSGAPTVDPTTLPSEHRAAAATPRTPRPRRRRRAGAGERGARPHGGPIDGDAAGALAGREGRAQHGAGARHRRVGDRQGAGRARDPRGQRARREPFVAGQLQRDPGAAAGGGVLRLPQGRVHRRQRRPRRLLPGRQRRHAVPRRDRRPAAVDAVEAAARDPGALGAAGRRGRPSSRSTCGCSAPPTRTSAPRCRPASSARICTTG